LFTRTRDHRGSNRIAPAVVVYELEIESQIGEDRCMVEVTGDLFGAAAGGEMLRAVERRASLLGREVQQILGHLWDGAPRALLPRRVGGGIDDHLAHDAPARVVGLAASDQKPRQGLGEDGGVGLGAARVKVPQCFADVAAISNGAGKLSGGAAWSPRGADWH
jgi:hypothetical protein